MPYRAQHIRIGDTRTVTVIDTGSLDIVQPAHEYLSRLRAADMSHHTIRSYATAFAEWWTFLELTGHVWDRFPSTQIGEFLTWLRTGIPPGVRQIGTPQTLRSPATLEVRQAAVLSLYRYHEKEHDLEGPIAALRSANHRSGRRRRQVHTKFLEGIDRRDRRTEPMGLNVRRGPRDRTPILAPDAYRALLNALQPTDPMSPVRRVQRLRDELLFTMLMETGMRLGEALSLRNRDFILGSGRTPYIHIGRNLDHPGQLRPKSGYRSVYVDSTLEQLYSSYLYALLDIDAPTAIDGTLDDDWMFTIPTRGYTPMKPAVVYSTIRELNIRVRTLPNGWTPHWLRHTHVSALLLAGVDPTIVSRRVGHTSLETTLNLYGWVTEDAALRSVVDWKTFTDNWQATAR